MSNQSQEKANTLKTPGAPPFEIPNPPNEFGQDGGGFYGAYDVLADEVDEDLVTSLREQLEGVLVFAGLFAGVNSAFLALTLPLLSSDPSDDTNALLAQNNAILLQFVTGRNDTIPSDSSLPSTTFSPSRNIFIINLLFGLSLALAIVVSFLAVLGRQWLVYYRKRSGGGPDRQRWDQLKRFLGAKRWRLGLILGDIIPSLLQIALIIFCVSLMIYLHHLNPTLSILVGIPLYLGLAFFTGSAFFTVWDRFCPFHSSLSHLLRWAVKGPPFVLRVVSGAIVSGFKPRAATRIFRYLKRMTRWIQRFPTRLQLRDFVRRIPIKSWLQSLIRGREEEGQDLLQVVTLQRAICTSDVQRTLLYASSNILGLGTEKQMVQLWNDKNFSERFFDQFENFHERASQVGVKGSGQMETAVPAIRLYCAAIAHSVLTLNRSWQDLTDFVAAIHMTGEISIWIPRQDIPGCSTCFIRATLAFTIFQFHTEELSPQTIKNLYGHLARYSECLKHGDWRLFSLISWAVANVSVTKKVINTSLKSLRKAYTGDFEEVVRSLQGAFEVLVKERRENAHCEGILNNMLQFPEQVILDKAQSTVGIKGKFALSVCWERIILNSGVPEATRQRARKLTINLAQIWQRECRKEKVPDDFCSVLEQHLTRIRTEYMADPVYHEYIELLQLFRSAISGLLFHKHDASNRDSLCNAFEMMVLHAASISLQIMRNARRIRDPDQHYCHRQEVALLEVHHYSINSVATTGREELDYQRHWDKLAPYPYMTH